MMPYNPPRSTAATPMYSRIPAALARVSRPNKSCMELMMNTRVWNEFCADLTPYDSTQSPFENMPPGGREIQRFGAIPLSSVPLTGANTVVLVETAPIGYDGVIGRVVNMFTGTGFVEGSGGIVWRVQIGNKYARNLGSIPFTYGSMQDPFAIPGIGLPVTSGQTITYYVSIPPGSPVGGTTPQIICGLFGWYWPRK